jgi:hypothetical protein
MNYKEARFILFYIISIIVIIPALRAEGEKNTGKNPSLIKTNSQIAVTTININNLSSYFFNNGISDISTLGNSGLYYPKGSGNAAVFSSGLVWGARVAGDPYPRVGGSAYRTGLVPGKVLSDGNADDPNLDKYRIYRVRRDVYPGGPEVDFSTEVSLEGFTKSEIRQNYERDWKEWPVDMGAPFEDLDGDNIYDPTFDIPGMPYADQTIWFVANDLDFGQTRYFYGANPLGIECQVTIWAYNRADAIGNMFFRKYKLINITDRPTLNPTTFEDMYVSIWSDVDLGDAGDDFVGVDTTLSLQYCYNADPVDATYTPLPPPAVGFDFLQGPIVNGIAGQDINKNGIDDADDFGVFNGNKVGPGKINLPMTAAYTIYKSAPNYSDPILGNIEGSKQFYNFFQGKYPTTGEPFKDPVTGEITKFALPGDPVTGVGWLDGSLFPPGDRRMGNSSGPFNMAPGDTQEVIIAEIVAGALEGMSNLSAITILRSYSESAQLLYKYNFVPPTAPPAPVVKITELDKKIILDWGEDIAKVKATESFNLGSYNFQGYNVYQLPDGTADVKSGIRLATFDIIDGIKRIRTPVFDPIEDELIIKTVQRGEDSGIIRYIEITTDEFTGHTLINGKRYYFAVTSYSYSPTDMFPNSVENPIKILTAIPQSALPGLIYGHEPGEGLEVIHSQGSSDAVVKAKVINPALTTGHEYKVFFTQVQEIRNENGDWVPTNPGKLNKPDDLAGTSISIAALYAPNPERGVQLDFLLNMVSSTNARADGITISFPAGVTVISTPSFDAGGGRISPIVERNVVKMGLVNGELTHNGFFHGGEIWTIFISKPGLPMNVDWIVHDDGYSNPAGPIVDAAGVTEVSEIATLSRVANYWNLQDVTTGQLKLQNQGVYSGVDLYPRRDDQVTVNYSLQADPQVDGVQLGVVSGSLEAPIDIKTGGSFSFTRGPWSNTYSLYTTNTGIANAIYFTDYTVFSGVETSHAIDNFGIGTSSIEQLQQDYEIRFTGEYEETTPGSGVFTVIRGGQMATCFSMLDESALANHPLNPSPGTAEPFLVDIPFEVWNISDPANPYQVNVTFRDRVRNGTERPFYTWNPANRMYAIIVNSPYDPNQIIQVYKGPDQFNAAATWIFVTWSCDYDMGDVLRLKYNNPIQIGVDEYTFKTLSPEFSIDLAKSQVNEINVFPNPYYGVNSEELNKYNKFVTFSHLPEKAKFRIFNLAGVLVRTLEKDDAGQFFRWDLRNEFGFGVASGLYIVYIELPELGTTKVLKLAVIQEYPVLDRF